MYNGNYSGHYNYAILSGDTFTKYSTGEIDYGTFDTTYIYKRTP